MNSWRAILPLGLRVSLRRFQRRLWNAAHREATARARISRPEAFPHVVARHESRLIRSVPQEMRPLQHSKIRNLELGCARMDRLLIERGEVFSFCALIGRTSYRRGFVDGLEMHAGRLVGAPGGGLCQLANLIFWMGLHLDLDILERHRHELDLFPDDGRSVPFGMGASVFYNYRDLRLRNHLSQPLVLRVGVRPPRLWGTVLSDRPLPFRVEIIERSHRFFRGSEGKV